MGWFISIRYSVIRHVVTSAAIMVRQRGARFVEGRLADVWASLLATMTRCRKNHCFPILGNMHVGWVAWLSLGRLHSPGRRSAVTTVLCAVRFQRQMGTDWSQAVAAVHVCSAQTEISV
jgi:hypothetical protein